MKKFATVAKVRIISKEKQDEVFFRKRRKKAEIFFKKN